MSQDQQSHHSAQHATPLDQEEAEARRARRQKKRILAKLSTLAGGAIAIWLGIALWAGLGWGVALAGIGVILLFEQLARRHSGLRYDLFWVVAGAIALIGGMLISSGVDIRFGPVILITVGIFIVLSTLLGDKGKV
ncbi:MAG: hypothetical protein JJU21_11730 [Salinarimonas sp.]|nr:hypothetical protein [Salinarimonas sp.]